MSDEEVIGTVRNFLQARVSDHAHVTDDEVCDICEVGVPVGAKADNATLASPAINGERNSLVQALEQLVLGLALALVGGGKMAAVWAEWQGGALRGRRDPNC